MDVDEVPVPVEPLPDVAGLSTCQVRGVACVWCETDLSSAALTVDLGRQVWPLPGARSYWFPRACTTCPPKAAR